jgi:transposase InsO family protein
MREIFAAADGNYGVPRMHRELRHVGLIVNDKRVRRLMRLHGMAGRCIRRRVRTTFPGPDGYEIPDLVGRAFTPGAPDVAWCQDVTYIATGEGWLYLASVLDLGSRRLLGYSMADHMRTELVLDALTMAIAARDGAVAGVIAHADRGSQYTSNDYLDFCQTHQLRPSVGRVATCFDNAVAESFWASLKRECIQGRVFASRAEARRAIFRWITWYNTTRQHSSLDHTSPINWEQQYRQASSSRVRPTGRCPPGLIDMPERMRSHAT